MGRCKFINCNICTTTMGNIDEGGGVSCGGSGWAGVYVNSVLSVKFCCKPINALKNSLLKTTKNKS